MPALPALTEPYFTRGNRAFPSVATATALVQSYLWCLAAALTDQLTGGSTSGTRDPASVATVLGSSNGSAAGLDAVDRWNLASFTAANLVRANNGVAHGWMALQLGSYQYVIDLNSASNGTFSIAAAPVASPFSGGSTTTRPTSSEEFMLGSLTVNSSSPVLLFSDSTTGSSTWFHFAINADGSRWWCSKSRTTQGVFDSFIGFWKGSGGRAGDTRNSWWLTGGATATGRGSGNLSAVTTTGAAVRRGYAGAAPASGGIRTATYGGVTLSGAGIDQETGDYLAVPLEVAVAASTIPLACGVLPDLHLLSGGTVASSIPSVGAQVRTVIGDLIVPCGIALTV